MKSLSCFCCSMHTERELIIGEDKVRELTDSMSARALQHNMSTDGDTRARNAASTARLRRDCWGSTARAFTSSLIPLRRTSMSSWYFLTSPNFASASNCLIAFSSSSS